MSTRRETMIARTQADMASAEALLRSLEDCRAAAARGLSVLRRPDLLPTAEGAVSVESAIGGAKRLLEAYNRVLDELARGLTDEELALLGDLDRTDEPPRLAA